jgi:hypothetical protein
MPPRLAWVVEQGMVVEGMDKVVPSPCAVADNRDTSPCPDNFDFQNKGVFGFSDAEEIKKRARERAKQKPTAYNVHSCYHKKGFFQKVARHIYFENATLAVIVVNAVWIAVDSDENQAETLLDAKWPFVCMDIAFFGYFCMELFVRFMAFERKCNCLKDGWFVFDTSLVTLYLFDPFIIALAVAASGGGKIDLPTSVLRLFRLARLSRLVRMLKSLPELMIMIKGMVTAAATVSYTLGLLLIFTYVFAIAMTQLSLGFHFRDQYFDGVALSMYSLIVYGTFQDSLADFCDDIREESSACLMVVTVYVVLASMTVMNMLIGILCEVISAVAVEEKETMITEKAYDIFGKIVRGLDKNGDGAISFREVEEIVGNGVALQALGSVNVDPGDLIDVAEDFLNEGSKEMSFDDFMEMLLGLRGGLQATLKDIYFVGKRFNKKFMELKVLMDEFHHKLDKMLQEP